MGSWKWSPSTGTWTDNSYHDAWEGYMEMERTQLSERASGKLRSALGRALSGESSEDLERIAADDERLARAGLVRLERSVGKTCYKHVEELRREDRSARILAERETIEWLRRRIEADAEAGRDS